MRVIIPGASGAIARKLAMRLTGDGHQVIGVDRRPWPDAPIAFHEVDVRKRAAEEVFRHARPDVVVHMATVTSLVMPGEERTKINLGGTRAVFEYSRAYGVQHCIFVGRHTFYGAGPESPLFHVEDEPPLALDLFPELADLVAADLFAATALWRLPELATTVLRPCYTLGTTGHGTLAGFIRGRHVPMVMGFDPLFQYLHEDDLVEAIARTIETRPRGVYNVAGPQPLPLSCIVREAARTPVRVPEFILERLIGRFGFPTFPTGALTHIKYPVVVDGKAFRDATGFEHRHDELETVATFRRAFPRPG
jgi:UDP-glucose 4-epimerase